MCVYIYIYIYIYVPEFSHFWDSKISNLFNFPVFSIKASSLPSVFIRLCDYFSILYSFLHTCSTIPKKILSHQILHWPWIIWCQCLKKTFSCTDHKEILNNFSCFSWLIEECSLNIFYIPIGGRGSLKMLTSSYHLLLPLH